MTTSTDVVVPVPVSFDNDVEEEHDLDLRTLPETQKFVASEGAFCSYGHYLLTILV